MYVGYHMFITRKKYSIDASGSQTAISYHCIITIKVAVYIVNGCDNDMLQLQRYMPHIISCLYEYNCSVA